MMRGRTRSPGEAYCNNIAQRLVRVPSNLLGSFSRAMNRGIDLIGNRRTHDQQLPPPNLPLPYNPQPQPVIVQDEWAFLTSFEQQYGTFHPFFYACRFTEALRIAKDGNKFMFVYLHLPDHPFTQSFCREALCSELVVQFLDVNFVSWAGLADRGEGLHMATNLQPASYPFCAVVAPASGDNMAVLQQIEGPVSPAELVGILEKTMCEQGLAFGCTPATEGNNRRADELLREEQDAAYLAAFRIDQEKDELIKRVPSEDRRRAQKQVETSNKENDPKMKQPVSQMQEATTSRETRQEDVTQILIRFPNGERREQSFMSTDKVEAIYGHIDSLGLPGVGNYRLISSFPRKVFDVDHMEMTLRDAGLHPRASIFLELL